VVLEVVESNDTRESLIALLRSPHFQLVKKGAEGTADRGFRRAVSALDRALCGERYLGGLDRLEELAKAWSATSAVPALEVAVASARELAPLCEAAPASVQISRLSSFLAAHFAPLDDGDRLAGRARRARSAVQQILDAMAAAHRAHHDPLWTFADLAPA